jgi:superfamily II DNA or RNA helicase
VSVGIKLRPYQTECIDAVFKAWVEDMRRPAVVLPTGAGKTVVFSHLIKQWRTRSEDWSECGERVIVLVHRDELADQAIAKIRATLPDGVTVGKVKAHDDAVHADVMVCSVQTLASAPRRIRIRRAELESGPVGLIITDECHHAAAASYRKVYDAFPDALNLGVTATLARGDKVGLGGVWDGVVYSKSVLWMISQGYLSDVRTKHVEAKGLDLSGVTTSRGDYAAGSLGDAMQAAGFERAIVEAYVEHAKDRPGVVFTPTVATAESAADALNAAGVRTEVITGATTREDRLRIFDAYRRGEVQTLANCMVLTEGFDAPWAEVAVIARPTKSAPLYTQMVGRVLRTWPGKTEALVLDLVGASSHKLRTLVDLDDGAVKVIKEDETLGEAAEREAAEANTLVPGSAPAFTLRARDVDTFAGSEHAWQRTPKGVLYLQCGGAYVLLWPSEREGWDVVHAPEGQRWVRTRHRGLDIASAMAWGESVAEDVSAFSTQRSARWRKQRPSDAQLTFAESLGIDVAGMNRGDVSVAIDSVKAARAIDRYVR